MWSLKGISLIISALSKNYREFTTDIAYASLLGGMVISQAGTILLHAIGYPLTVEFDIPHGKANAIMLKPTIDFLKDSADEKYQALENILERNNLHSFDELLEKINISYNLADYGIKEDNIGSFVRSVMTKKNLNITPKKTTEENVTKIYLSRLPKEGLK